MFDHFINNLSLRAKSKTGASGEVVVWMFAGVVLSICALVFLSLAAYAWLVTIYSSAVAWLIVGGAHLVILGAVMPRCISVRRHNRELAQARLELAAKQYDQSAWKLDPALLAMGLEVAKTIGLRNLFPLLVGGIAAVGAGWAHSRVAKPPNGPPRR